MQIPVNNSTYLALLNHQHNEDIFRLIDENRAYFKAWLMFIDNTNHVNDVRDYCTESTERNRKGLEHAYVILHENQIVGRIGIYKVDLKNHTGDIAYWLSPQHQGKGIMIQSCQALVDYAFKNLELNRLEIRCTVDNPSSIAIPKKLNFTLEGTMLKSKRTRTGYDDVELFSMLRDHYNEQNGKLLK